MGETRTLTIEEHAFALERELRNNHSQHYVTRALFGSKRTDSMIEAEELPVLKQMAKDPPSALQFVSENTCEDIRKAHIIKIPGLSETYAGLEKEVILMPLPINGDSSGILQFQPIPVSFYPKSETNLGNSQKIVSLVAGAIRYKRPH